MLLNFFAEQCSLIPNRNVLLPELALLTGNTLTSYDFCKTGILKIINNQDLNKVHDNDMISRLLKLCGGFVCKTCETFAINYFP